MGMYLMRQLRVKVFLRLCRFSPGANCRGLCGNPALLGLVLVLIVMVPGLLALVFGWFAFRSKIKGVYFSIMTQALTYAGMLLFFRNETVFGGNNGFTGFTTLLGFSVTKRPSVSRCFWRPCCC